MRAVVQTGYGGPEVLRTADVPAPEPGPGQVLVRVRAASLHPDVWHMIAGRPYALRLMGAGVRRPGNVVPGTDVAGTVEAVGPGVRRFAPGDEVLGETRTGHQWRNAGAFAELAVAPERRLELRPARLSVEQAAALPSSGFIAVQAVRDQAAVRAGMRVLVHGAAGGVGHLAVQIASALGAHVTASDVPAKLPALRALGAHEVLDAVPPPRATYDAVVDVPGDRPFAAWRDALTEDGRYVLVGHDLYGQKGGRALGAMAAALRLMAQSPFRRQLAGVRAAADPGDRLRALVAWADAGAVAPVVDRTYPLGEAADALRHLMSGDVVGKVVLRV